MGYNEEIYIYIAVILIGILLPETVYSYLTQLGATIIIIAFGVIHLGIGENICIIVHPEDLDSCGITRIMDGHSC